MYAISLKISVELLRFNYTINPYQPNIVEHYSIFKLLEHKITYEHILTISISFSLTFDIQSCTTKWSNSSLLSDIFSDQCGMCAIFAMSFMLKYERISYFIATIFPIWTNCSIREFDWMLIVLNYITWRQNK